MTKSVLQTLVEAEQARREVVRAKLDLIGAEHLGKVLALHAAFQQYEAEVDELPMNGSGNPKLGALQRYPAGADHRRPRSRYAPGFRYYWDAGILIFLPSIYGATNTLQLLVCKRTTTSEPFVLLERHCDARGATNPEPKRYLFDTPAQELVEALLAKLVVEMAS